MNRIAQRTFAIAMSNKWVLGGTLVVVIIVGGLGFAWVALPSLAPRLVLAHPWFADPVVRALIARDGDGFAALAHDPFSTTEHPSDPWRWVLRIRELRGDPRPALLRAAHNPRPGRAFLAVALLAEWRHLSHELPTRDGIRWRSDDVEGDAALIAVLRSTAPIGTRILAARSLAGREVDAAMPVVLGWLDDPSPLMRRRAAFYLGHWGDAWRLTPWDRSGRKGRPDDPGPGVFGAPTAVSALLTRLDGEPEPDVRGGLVSALALIGDERADAAIAAAIASDGVSSWVRRSLSTWTSPIVKTALEAQPPVAEPLTSF